MSSHSPSEAETDTSLPRPQSGCAYFLDVDGTLIPHHDRVEDARPGTELRSLVNALAASSPVALISGRKLSDLHELFGCASITLIGQNGLEGRDTRARCWQQRTFNHPLRQRIVAQLQDMQSHHPDMAIEDKGLMLSLHCRLMPIHYTQTLLPDRLIGMLRQCTQRADDRLVLGWGKTGVDVMPCRYGKRQAIAWLLSQPGFAGRRPVFAGDDWADESAFIEVNERRGISIKVGAGWTAARYRVDQVEDIHRWLRACHDCEAANGSS